ncbi:MAG: helix-turn-helix transcriptional regulator [Oscillospiraceae bacterium]|nr:helix-turn-helix transcriptional regulator [Oscillospiraceae bacterium]
MLNDNIRTIRKARGYSQEELAIRLNVVRQTVSKWEKGLSVPDAELLSKMAEVLEVSVEELLGEPKTQPREDDAVVEQLARINEQLAVKNRRARRIWRIIGIILAALVLLNIIGVVLFSADTKTGPRQESTEIVTETVETGSEP